MSKVRSTIPLTSMRPALFYGYVIVIASFFIMVVSYGSRFSFGVFFTPMVSEMGWSNATTSLAYSISMFVEGIFSIVMGWLTDKYGPRLTITIAGILMGLGYCLMPLINSAWQLYIFYGFIVGAGLGGTFVPIMSIVMKWFKQRRNLMVGIVGSGIGIGLLIMAPVATRLMDTFNWRTTFLIIGILIVLVMVIAAQLFKREPGNSGLNLPGEFVKNDQNVINQGPSFQWSIRTCQFWSIFFAIFCFTFTSFSVLIYLVPKAILAGISPVVAATILASVGILQVVGRIFSGLVADRIGNKRVFIIGFIITIAILMLIINSSTLWVFYVFAIIYGLVQGSISTSQPSLVASLFGSKNLGLILGGISFGFTLGAAVGPYTVGYLFDNTGNYNTGLLVCAGISIIGLLLILSLKPFHKTSGISKL